MASTEVDRGDMFGGVAELYRKRFLEFGLSLETLQCPKVEQESAA